MNPKYRLYHPKWHRTRIPIFWWLRNLAYTKFISRELTSVAVAYAGVLLLIQAWAIAQGGESYARFQAWLGSSVALVWHGAILLVLLFHTVTWLNLTPKAVVLRVQGRKVPDGLVQAAHYGAWLGCSGLLAWLILGR